MSTESSAARCRRSTARRKVTGAARYAADAKLPRAGPRVHGDEHDRPRPHHRDRHPGRRALRGVVAVYTHETMPRLTQPTYRTFLKPFIPMQDDRRSTTRASPSPSWSRRPWNRHSRRRTWSRSTTGPEPHPKWCWPRWARRSCRPPRPDGRQRPMHAATRRPAWPQAHVRAKAAYTTPMQHHNPIEPPRHHRPPGTATADGVREPHRALHGTRQTRSCRLSGSPPENVRVISPYLGGGFGAKGPVWPHTLLTAAAARRSAGRSSWCCPARRCTPPTATAPRPPPRSGSAPPGRACSPRSRHLTQQVTRIDEHCYNSSDPTRILYACPNVHDEQMRRTAGPAHLQLHALTGDGPRTSRLESALDELELRARHGPGRAAGAQLDGRQPGDRRPLRQQAPAECYGPRREAFGWSRREPAARAPCATATSSSAGAWPPPPTPRAAGPVRVGLTILARTARVPIQVATQDIGTGTYTVHDPGRRGRARHAGLATSTLRTRRHHLPAQRSPSAASTTVPSVGGAGQPGGDRRPQAP